MLTIYSLALHVSRNASFLLFSYSLVNLMCPCNLFKISRIRKSFILVANCSKYIVIITKYHLLNILTRLLNTFISTRLNKPLSWEVCSCRHHSPLQFSEKFYKLIWMDLSNFGSLGSIGSIILISHFNRKSKIVSMGDILVEFSIIDI